jgi:hypothetical protein
MGLEIRFLFIFFSLCFIACSNKGDLTPATAITSLPKVPAETKAILEKSFPGVLKGSEFSDSLLYYLKNKYDVTSDQILMGASTCVDDIIYTKNFHLHPEIKGPFHLGGLAGLPFTGISGLEAFAHHIPEGGTLFLLITPHIGYSDSEGWGYVLRHGQHEPSSCCGALMGTLAKLQNGKIASGITEEDYQGGKIGELTLAHQKEILEAENPIIELTKLTSQEAERQIRAHILDVNLEHIKYIVIVTGIIINTDYLYSDYIAVGHLMVYDVNKKTFVVDLKVH